MYNIRQTYRQKGTRLQSHRHTHTSHDIRFFTLIIPTHISTTIRTSLHLPAYNMSTRTHTTLLRGHIYTAVPDAGRSPYEKHQDNTYKTTHPIHNTFFRSFSRGPQIVVQKYIIFFPFYYTHFVFHQLFKDEETFGVCVGGMPARGCCDSSRW